MTLRTVVAGFLGLYLAIAAGTLASYRPAPVPIAAPTPSNSWPDYSAAGPGFVAPARADGQLIDYGYRLVAQTFAEIGPNVSEPAHRLSGNNLACQSCHLDGGTNRSGLPLVGVMKTFPKFSQRDGRVISLRERINECMERSMNGHALAEDSREMAAYLAYMQFIDPPKPIKSEAAPSAQQPPDAVRGKEVYLRVCAVCHQPDGQGVRLGSASQPSGYQFPPLWGPDSFNDGAGMHRYDRAVGFIHSNMPRGATTGSPQLTLQETWDVVAFLREKPRPHYSPAP